MELASEKIHPAVDSKLKRGMDLLGACAGLAVLSPVMMATGGAILATMGSPVLFRQQRPGLGGKRFTFPTSLQGCFHTWSARCR